VAAGSILGPIKVSRRLADVDVALVPGHDTSCAFEAIPRDGNSLIVSSGTWMLVGGITDKPCLGDAAFELGVSNERTGLGGYRPNKILLGLWLLERTIPAFDKRPQTDAEWSSLISAAAERAVPEVLIDTKDEALFNPSDMRAAIDRQLKANGGTAPEDLPGYVSLICASLGASVRDTALRFESILKTTFENIVIVGGGSKNGLLCQMLANYSGKRVTSYNLEATSVGNMAYQLMAIGKIQSLSEFHDLIRPSLSAKVYQPR
jgi:rhamnulokinase